MFRITAKRRSAAFGGLPCGTCRFTRAVAYAPLLAATGTSAFDSRYAPCEQQDYMIFDGRSLDEVSNEELVALVTEHAAERQHMEFKATFNHKDEPSRLEILKDIASLANGGGGYLFIGIRDDGSGRAQKFEPDLLRDHEAVARSIRALALEHIADRIDGLEIRVRDTGSGIIVGVRVPQSIRRPHMVTYQHGTHFVSRVEDGKREMTVAQIREMFDNGGLARQLTRIEARIEMLDRVERRKAMLGSAAQAVQSGSPAPFRAITDGTSLAEYQREHFESDIGTAPFFWISATPTDPSAIQLDLTDQALREFLIGAPGSRRSGWNMAGFDAAVSQGVGVLELGFKDYELLRVFENLHSEFWSPVDEHFCWRQSEDEQRIRPRLYPYPVIEYPTTFLRLVKALYERVSYEGSVIVQIDYRNIRGSFMRPGAPGSGIFDSSMIKTETYSQHNLLLGPVEIGPGFDPDQVAYGLIRDQYLAFGLDPNRIPFRTTEGRFDFGE